MPRPRSTTRGADDGTTAVKPLPGHVTTVAVLRLALGLEERQHRLAAVGRDLKWAALEASRPKVEPFDWFEPEALRVPRRRLGSVGHADVDVVESAHAERARVGHVSQRTS